VSVRQTRIGAVTYKVWRKPGTSNTYIAETQDNRPGSRKGATSAVIKLFNCQRANMRPADDRWRRSEGKGSFCDGYREWQPLR
ncbi:MAG: hypothetical protein R3245_11170, partial [Kiloniellales bacterium]|nr:hypothetical protein [Kiloniellales bacterium]